VLGNEVVAAALDDWRTAPLDPRLRATLGFLEKLTLDPGAVGPDDAGPLREAGVTDDQVESAVWVAFAFNVIDRIADALAFEVPGPEAFAAAARPLLRFGYRV
jgi:alkylhydroperoxidase family enzyme